MPYENCFLKILSILYVSSTSFFTLSVFSKVWLKYFSIEIVNLRISQGIHTRNQEWINERWSNSNKSKSEINGWNMIIWIASI